MKRVKHSFQNGDEWFTVYTSPILGDPFINSLHYNTPVASCRPPGVSGLHFPLDAQANLDEALGEDLRTVKGKSKVNCNSNSIYFLFLLANIAPSSKARSP